MGGPPNKAATRILFENVFEENDNVSELNDCRENIFEATVVEQETTASAESFNSVIEKDNENAVEQKFLEACGW